MGSAGAKTQAVQRSASPFDLSSSGLNNCSFGKSFSNCNAFLLSLSTPGNRPLNQEEIEKYFSSGLEIVARNIFPNKENKTFKCTEEEEEILENGDEICRTREVSKGPKDLLLFQKFSFKSPRLAAFSKYWQSFYVE